MFLFLFFYELPHPMFTIFGPDVYCITIIPGQGQEPRFLLMCVFVTILTNNISAPETETGEYPGNTFPFLYFSSIYFPSVSGGQYIKMMPDPLITVLQSRAIIHITGKCQSILMMNTFYFHIVLITFALVQMLTIIFNYFWWNNIYLDTREEFFYLGSEFLPRKEGKASLIWSLFW